MLRVEKLAMATSLAIRSVILLKKIFALVLEKLYYCRIVETKTDNNTYVPISFNECHLFNPNGCNNPLMYRAPDNSLFIYDEYFLFWKGIS